MKNDIDPLVELAVWGHLDSKTDLELILLKGHLLLEIILDTTLKRNNVINCDNLSFHRKILTLEKVSCPNDRNKTFIISSLQELNRLRNKMAHEFHFDINNKEFEVWASSILHNLQGTKYSKYTFRTKIVHSFSILAKNILEMNEPKIGEYGNGE